MERVVMGAEQRGDGPAGTPPAPAQEQSTGLPLLHTWRAVYVFVVIAFVAWVVLLTALERVFS